MASKSYPVPTNGLHANSGNATTNPQKDGVIFASGSYTAVARNSPEYNAGDVRGVRLYIDIVTVNGGTLTVKIQTRDPQSNNWTDLPLAVTTALAAATTTTLTVYPGVTETGNFDVANPLGSAWRVVATTAVATMVWGIGAEYLG